MPRILVFGNSGSGKTTLARALARTHDLHHLDLDGIAWEAPGVRMPLVHSAAYLDDWLAQHSSWVIEGCYADLLELALPRATALYFLNPGVPACIHNCRSRAWEPEKYPSKAAQDEMLEVLVEWVRQYETRTDEYSLARHRALFDSFAGPKWEITGDAGTVAG